MQVYRIAAVVVLGLFALGLMSAVPVAHAQTPPYLNVTYKASLDQRYTVYGYLTDQMEINVNGSVSAQSVPDVVSVYFPFSFSDVKGLSSGENYTVADTTLGSSTYSLLQVTIPSGSSSFDFTVEGTITGLSSLFFRDIANIPSIEVSMSLPPFTPTSFSILVPQEPSMQVRDVYPSNGSQFIDIGGQSYLQLDPAVVSSINCQFCSAGISLIYQSKYSDYYAFLAIVAIAGVVLLLASVGSRLGKGVNLASSKIPSFLSLVLHRIMRRGRAKTLFMVFVLLCLSMIALSAVFGPPPQPRAYLSATAPTVQTLGPYVKDAGWSFLDYGAAADGFSRTSGYGTFSAAIIADYQPSIVGQSPYQEGLNYVPVIIILSEYVPASYVSQVEAIHPYNTIVLSSPSQIPSALARIGGRQNVLGLTISTGVYHRVEQIVGLLSLVVPFLAIAFLSSFAVELGGTSLGGAFELMGYAVMVYFLADFAFIVSTVMLGTPVAMHAAISSKETAEGLLGGFGGGTRPREASGVLGFVFGIVYNKKGSLSYDRNVLIALAAALAFVIADPLNVATNLYEVFLTVSSNSGVGIAGPTYNLLRGLIGQPVGFFQSYITSDFVASHGATLFFAASVPMTLYSRVGKATGTLLLLFGAFGCAIGFIRVADMVPTETLASMAPGFLLAAAIIPVFFAINLVESFIRGRL